MENTLVFLSYINFYIRKTNSFHEKRAILYLYVGNSDIPQAGKVEGKDREEINEYNDSAFKSYFSTFSYTINGETYECEKVVKSEKCSTERVDKVRSIIKFLDDKNEYAKDSGTIANIVKYFDLTPKEVSNI